MSLLSIHLCTPISDCGNLIIHECDSANQVKADPPSNYDFHHYWVVLVGCIRDDSPEGTKNEPRPLCLVGHGMRPVTKQSN